MTRDELLARLAPIRVPLGFAEFTLRDALVMLCLGMLAGLVLVKLIGFLSTQRRTPEEQARTEIARLATAAPGLRLTGLARLLKAHDPQASKDLGLQDALYDPAALVDFAAVETAILEAARSGSASVRK